MLGLPMISLLGLLLPFALIGVITIAGLLMVFGFAVPIIVLLTLILVAAGITLAIG
jgi:hypothetical protein